MTASSHTVIVTGATSGFGSATAQKFAEAGAHVVVAGRREERLAALKDQFGDLIHAIPLDVRDNAAVAVAFSDLPPPFDAPTVLVNNAGLALGLQPADKADLEEWTRMIDTNITGLTTVTHAVLPGMVDRGHGHIINLGSVAGTYPYPGGNVYGATKAFVHQFSLNLRGDLVDKNIRVTCVEPGAAETEFSEVRLGDRGKAAEFYKGFKPLSAEDVAEAVFFAATLPEHVNINVIEMMPTAQAFAGYSISRGGEAAT